MLIAAAHDFFVECRHQIAVAIDGWIVRIARVIANAGWIVRTVSGRSVAAAALVRAPSRVSRTWVGSSTTLSGVSGPGAKCAG